jgi:hypothetical protein
MGPINFYIFVTLSPETVEEQLQAELMASGMDE